MKKLTEEQIQEEKTKYTRKIEIPIYEPKNDMPDITELYNKTKCNALISNIKKADIPEYIKDFLYSAAERHTQFNFSKIADYYAHSDLKVKKLFEESALVIIDYDSAIKNGFIAYQENVDEDLDVFLNSLTEEKMIENINRAKKKKENAEEEKELDLY